MILLTSYLFFFHKHIKLKPSSFEESNLALDNPCRGFYHIYRYSLDIPQKDLQVQVEEHITWEESERLALVEINLNTYADSNISKEGLSNISTILSTWNRSNKKLILRFLYDWDGNALSSEPRSLNHVITHMNQIAPIVNKYHQGIYLLQGVFLGNYGEMHDSRLLTNKNMRILANHLHNIIDSSIYLSVRTPAQWRLITGLNQIPNDISSVQGTIATRLGLFNDGMLGDISDVGTYTKENFTHGSSLTAEQVRKKEISFQNNLCRYVPNGGEVIINNPYNHLSSAIEDFQNMHVTYLNSAYDPAVIKKWKQSAYTGEDCYNGMNGFDYISLHLGYRLKITHCNLVFKKLRRTATTLKLTLENIGFSAPNQAFDSYLVIKNNDSQDVKQIPLTMDLSWLSSNESVTFTPTISMSDLSSGKYTLYYKLMDSQTKEIIKLANTNTSTELGYVIGQITVQK